MAIEARSMGGGRGGGSEGASLLHDWCSCFSALGKRRSLLFEYRKNHMKILWSVLRVSSFGELLLVFVLNPGKEKVDGKSW